MKGIRDAERMLPFVKNGLIYGYSIPILNTSELGQKQKSVLRYRHSTQLWSGDICKLEFLGKEEGKI